MIETVVLGKNWLFAVAGVGINLNQENFPADLPHAVSLKQITSGQYDPIQIARELVPSIQRRIHALKMIGTDSGRIQYIPLQKNQPIALRIKTELIIVTLHGVMLMVCC